ncbi:MAG: CRISPR-associated protein Cas4 [Desulfurococcales archaeon]|nr:CRISPR-associated protein Cas4 [Desulfurococcales archaeon]
MHTPSHKAIDRLLGVHKPVICDTPSIKGWDYPPGRIPPSSLASQCPTMRSLYLQVNGVRVESELLKRGASYHDEALGAWKTALKHGLNGLLELAGSIKTRGGLWGLSTAYRWIQHGEFPPVSIEPKIGPGGGFGPGKPDLVLGIAPVELVTSRDPAWYWSRKKVVVASYALILEYETGMHVNQGYLVGLEEGYVEAICIDDRLRVEALKLASLGEEALTGDPGLPRECPSYCLYRGTCLGDTSG